MRLSFNTKTIVVTGAGNGIGRAASILLANEDGIQNVEKEYLCEVISYDSYSNEPEDFTYLSLY